jgi:TolA-binding protein
MLRSQERPSISSVNQRISRWPVPLASMGAVLILLSVLLCDWPGRRAAVAQPRPLRPALTASMLFSETSPSMSVSENEIKTLQHLIESTPAAASAKPEQLFRLAELYAQQSRHYGSLVRQLNQKIDQMQPLSGNKELADLRAQKEDIENLEKEWTLKAVKKYVEVTNGSTYQNYPQMDRVLFRLSHLLIQKKKEDQALVFLRRIVKDYPASPFVPYGYIMLGEHLFSNNNLESAATFYDEACHHYPESPACGYALYRRGWIYVIHSDYKNALGAFTSLIDFVASKKRNPDDYLLNMSLLEKEARKDLVHAFSVIGRPEKAWPFFQRYGKEDAPAMMEHLANIYASEKNPLAAMKVRNELRTHSPR